MSRAWWTTSRLAHIPTYPDMLWLLFFHCCYLISRLPSPGNLGSGRFTSFIQCSLICIRVLKHYKIKTLYQIRWQQNRIPCYIRGRERGGAENALMNCSWFPPQTGQELKFESQFVWAKPIHWGPCIWTWWLKGGWSSWEVFNGALCAGWGQCGWSEGCKLYSCLIRV